MSLTIPRNFSSNNTLTKAHLDAAFDAVETKFNTTKIASSELQASSVEEAAIAAGAVTAGKIGAAAVTEAKLHGDVVAQLVPAGVILPYGGATAPTGYLACDGSAVSRTTYADLFTAISTTWGAGDASTTFNLPDLRGRAPIGSGTGSGLTARTLGASVGAENHVLTQAELPAHTHTVTDPGHSHAYNGSFTSIQASGILAHDGGGAIQTSGTRSASTGISVSGGGSGAAHTSMQPSAVVNFIIKT